MAPLVEKMNGGSSLLSTRAAREAEASRLRSEGLLLREIAERMGVAISTVDAYLNDPGGRRLKARQDSYRGSCTECGAPTNGNNGPTAAPERCIDCVRWSDEERIEAIKLWAEKHGGIPPTVNDWRPAGPDHPSSTAFGRNGGIGWNEAILRAGYALHMDRRPETQQWVEDQISAGVPVADIAADLGVSTAAIYHRINKRGMSVLKLRRAA
jgi:hypothetical protein